MKFRELLVHYLAVVVTLCVRVWIEIMGAMVPTGLAFVTLCVRVWIEIRRHKTPFLSLSVTLCVRVWIEIALDAKLNPSQPSHPLREGVD